MNQHMNNTGTGSEIRTSGSRRAVTTGTVVVLIFAGLLLLTVGYVIGASMKMAPRPDSEEQPVVLADDRGSENTTATQTGTRSSEAASDGEPTAEDIRAVYNRAAIETRIEFVAQLPTSMLRRGLTESIQQPTNATIPTPTQQPGANQNQNSQDNQDTRSRAARMADESAALEDLPLEFDPPEVDFGMVKPNTIHSHTIMIRNRTDQPVTILDSQPSCSCTAVELSNVTLEPGESIPMPISMDVRARLGERGTAVKLVLEHEGNTQVYVYKLTAHVARDVVAEPAHIYAADELSGVLSVYSVDRQPFNILSVNGEPPQFVDFEPQVDSPQNEYRIQWSLEDFDPQTCRDSQGRRMRDFWVIETDHSGAALIDVQVRHNCTRPARPTDGRRWIIEERHVNIGDLQPGETTEFEFVFAWIGQLAGLQQPRSVLTQLPHVTTRIVGMEPLEDSPNKFNVRVAVTVDEDHPGGLLYDELSVNTADHSAPHILIGRVVR